MVLLGGIVEIVSAAYELSTVVTDVILNYEYVNRNWVEEYILSIIFLVASGVVMGFVGLGIDALYPNRFSSNMLVNKTLGFCIGLLQLRVFIETIYAVIARIKSGSDEKQETEPVDYNAQVDGNTVTQRQDVSQSKQLSNGLMYAMFIQVIVRDVPLFVLQANATIHYRKWKFIDIFTVISTFVTLTRGTAAYVAKEDGNGIKLLAFVFLVGQFAFRLGAILLLAMTKDFAILIYGLVIIFCAIISTAKLRLAHPSHRFVDQLPRAVIFFPFFTLFVVDGSTLTARYGATVPALRSTKLLPLHVWRCLENVVAIILAITLPRYTDFGVSSNGTVAGIGVICAAIYVVAGAVFYCAYHSCARHDSTTAEANNGVAAEVPYYLGNANTL